jgi:hypothetical protein
MLPLQLKLCHMVSQTYFHCWINIKIPFKNFYKYKEPAGMVRSFANFFMELLGQNGAIRNEPRSPPSPPLFFCF